MAAGRIVIEGFMPALDLNANPVPGARLTFFQNKTTALLPVYTDPELTVPHTNPVLANSGGQFPSIFADPGVAFTVSLADANGATLGFGSRDDVRAIGEPGAPSDEQVEMAVGSVLPPLIANKADQSALETTNETVATKADAADVNELAEVVDDASTDATQALLDAGDALDAAAAAASDAAAKASKAANLSDLADAGTARTNLGTVAKAGDTFTGTLGLPALNSPSGSQGLTVFPVANVGTATKASWVQTATTTSGNANERQFFSVKGVVSIHGYGSTSPDPGYVTDYRAFEIGPGSGDGWVDNTVLNYITTDWVNAQGFEMDINPISSLQFGTAPGGNALGEAGHGGVSFKGMVVTGFSPSGGTCATAFLAASQTNMFQYGYVAHVGMIKGGFMDASAAETAFIAYGANTRAIDVSNASLSSGEALRIANGHKIVAKNSGGSPRTLAMLNGSDVLNLGHDGAGTSVNSVLVTAPVTLNSSLNVGGALGVSGALTATAGIGVTGTATVTGTANLGAVALASGGKITGVGAGSAQRDVIAVTTSDTLNIGATALTTFHLGVGFFPNNNGTQFLGGGSNRWDSVWAVNPAIQTSDPRLKTDISVIDSALALDLVRELDAISFKWRETGGDRVKTGRRVKVPVQKTRTEVVTQMVQRIVKRIEDRPVMVREWKPVEGMEVIDGVATLTADYVEVDVPVYDEIPIVGADGSPVMEMRDVWEERDTVLRRTPQEDDADDVVERIIITDENPALAGEVVERMSVRIGKRAEQRIHRVLRTEPIEVEGPEWVEEQVEVETVYVEEVEEDEWETELRPGRRHHCSFDAEQVGRALEERGLNWGAYIVAEDGTKHLRPGELEPVLWTAVKALIGRLDALEAAA